jgi:hypothetical protein
LTEHIDKFMLNKYFNFLLLLAYLCLTSISVFGQNASFYKSSIILNTGSGNTYYDAGAATGNSDFNGNNLGIYSCTGTLILSGGEAEISKGGGCDVSSSKLAYRIYLLGSTTFPEFSEIDLPLSQDFGTCFSGNSCQSWAKTNAGVNLLSGLANGHYKIEAYFVGSTQFCTVGLFFDNNLNNNYSATFTISNPITITTNPSSSTVCFGSNTTLTASATGNDAFIWQKQNGASWTNVSNGSLVSGAPTTLNLTNVTTTEIYRCLFTNCGGINTLATQTVTVAPQRPTISLQPISQSDCDGNVIDFNITVSAGNTFIWQRKKPTDASYLTVAATTNSVITNTITTSQLKIRNIGNNENPHLAQYQCVVTDANSCINTTNVATLSVSSIRNIADSPTICERGTTSFTTTLIGTSTAIKWQKGTSETAAASYVDLVDSSPNIIGSGTTTLSLANIPLTDNNTFYRVKATFATVSNTGSGTCTQTQSVTAAITGKLTVIAAPTAPTANNASRCDVGTVILSATSTLGANESFRWYDSNVSSTVLGTNAIYKTESLAIGSYTYYLSVYNSSTTCESTRTAVVVIVNPLPTIALTNVADICNSVTTFSLPFSSITNSPNQYSISTGSPTLSGFSAISNASFGSSPINMVIPANASPDIYQFAISVKNSTTTCVSSNQSFTVKINSTPSAPIITTPVNFCQNVPTSALTATASGTNSLLWYGTSSVGTLSLSAPIPSSNIVGTTTYYVSQLSTDNCESAKAAIDVIVNAIPVPPSAKTTITYCKNSAANMLSAVASGSNSLIWYDENDNILGSAPTPNTTIAGTQIFKVSQKSPLPTNCESAKTTILVTIYDLPIAPTVTTPVGYCQNAIATSLSATASGTNTLLWYGTNAIGGTSSGTAQTPITTSVGTTSYYVSQKDANNCESLRAKIDVEITPSVSVIITGINAFCITGMLNKSTTLSAKPTGGNGSYTYQWQNLAGNIFSATNQTYEVSSTVQVRNSDTYSVTLTSGYCTATANVNVTKQGWSDVPNVSISPTSDICGSGSKTISVNSPNIGTYRWYSDATNLIQMASGTSFSTPNLTSTTSYYVAREHQITANLTCQTVRTLTTINVNPIPSAPTVTTDDDDNIVCAGANVKLSVSDCVGTVIWSNGTSATTITVSASGTYSAICIVNGCKSLSSSTQIIVVNQNPTITLGSISSICNAVTNFDLLFTATSNSPSKYSLTSTMSGFVVISDASLTLSPISVVIPSGKTGNHSFTISVKNSSTNCINSQTFNLTVLPVLLGGSLEVSSSTVNCSGYNAGVISSVSVASGGKTTYGYQWQSSTDNQNFANITSENLTTYNPPALNQTMFYRRKVTDACGAEAISSNVHQIQIVPDPQITITDATDRTICSSGVLNLEATVIGGSGTCTPTWQSSNSQSGIFTNEQVGGLSFSATVTNTSSASIIKYYRAIYACSGTGSGSCNQATSSLVKVTINPSPSVPIVNGGGTICSGSSTTLSANGCNGTLQWSNGATTTSVSVSTAGRYSAVCTNSCGKSASSNEIVVNITTLASPILVGATTVCSGQSTILTATDCAGTVVWSNSFSGTSMTVSPSTTTSYTAVCHTNGCISLNSEAVVVTVAPSIDFTIGSVADLCNSATSFVLPYNSTLGSPDKYSLTSTMAGFTSVIDASLGASPIIVSIPSGQAGTFGFTLTLKIGSTGCNKSQTFNVNILPALLGGSIETSSSTFNCFGYNAGVISSVNLASGGKVDYIYQWQSSIDNINFNDILGANLTTYDPPALNQTTFYRRKVTDACGAEAISSNVHQIQIVPDPQITITDVTDRIICSSGVLNLEATVIGGSGTCTPTWQSSNSQSGIFTNEQLGGLSFSSTVTNTTSATIIKYYRAIYACSGTGSGSCNQAISSLVKVTINPSPSVPIVNGGGTICSGSSTTLSANGCNGTLQWSNGATTTSVSVSTAGKYSAVCTNSCGKSASSNEIVVNITTLASPILVGATTVCSGQSTILTATDCAGTVVWSNSFSGTSMTVSPSTTTSYTAVCHTNGCISLNSEAVVVTVAPSIDFTLGSVANLCSSATSFILPYNSTLGSPDKYSLTSTMAGFTSVIDASLGASPIFVSIPSGQAGTFGFTLTLKIGSMGCKKSQTFNVNILPALLGGSIETSSSTFNCFGYNAGVISSVNLASGGKSDYVYQWQSSTDNINFTDISGANLTTYDPPALNQTTFYRRKVTDACGAEAISSNVHQIQIVPDPQITITDATDRTICSSGVLNLEATIIGGSGTCTPTWQSSNSLSGIFTNEQLGGLSFSSTVTNTTSVSIIKYYRAIYACSGTGSGSCNQAISSLVKVIINPNLNTPTITPISVIICPTQSTTLTASGCGGIVIWNVGQTGSTLSVSEAGTYSATCSLNSCLSAKSSSSTVKLSTGGIPVAPPVISGTATICTGQATNLLASNCLGTVKWSNGVTGNLISVNPSLSTDYTAICFDGTCTSSSSNKISITVNSFPNITTQPKNEVDCNGNSVTFSVTASSATSYQWQRKVPNGTFTNIDNAISNTLKISNIGSSIDPNQTEYRVVLSNQSCSVTSTVAVLTVNSATGSLADQTICDGGNVSFNLANMFFSGNIQSYQWQRRLGISGIWNDIVGATTTTLIINDASNADEQYYRCKINLTASESTCTRYTTENDSNGAKLTVLVASTPTITGTNLICKGRDTKLTANNCDGIIAWSNGLSMASITVSPTINTSYTVSCTSTQCGFNVTSEPFIVSVNETPQPEIITYDVITPSTLVFAAKTSVSNANLIWYNKASGGIATTTSPSFTAVGTYSYWVTQTDPITGCESVRLPIIAKVLDYFHISQQPTNQVDCKGNSVFLGLVAVGPNPVFTYQWQRKRPNEPDFVNLVEEGNGIRGWYARTMAVSNVGDVNNPDQTQYRCIVGNDKQFITSEISTLTVNSLEGSLPNLGICVGGNNEFNLQNFYNIKGNVVNYQWQTRAGTIGVWTNLVDGNGISGSNKSSLKFTNATYEQGVFYRCLVKFNTQGFECTESTDDAKLIVSGFPPAPAVSSVFYCQNANAVRLKVDSPIQNLVWYSQETGGTGNTIAPIPNTNIAGFLKYYVSDRTDEGCEGPRATINIEIGTTPTAPKNTTPISVNEGNILTFSAEGNSFENKVLRWYTSPTISTFSTTAPTFSAAGTYTRYVAQVSAFGCVGPRTVITATIIPNLKFIKQPLPQADCEGNLVTFSVSAIAPNIFTYQWQRQKPNDKNFIDLNGENANILKIANIGDGNNPNLSKYRCLIKDDRNTVISDEVTLTVNQIVGTMATMSLCEGKASKLSFNSLTISGNVVEYQWQKKIGSTYIDIPTNAIGVAIINEIGTYRGKITFIVDKNITCSRTTDDLKVEKKPTPTAPHAVNQNACLNTPFDVTKGVANINSLLWYKSVTDSTADNFTPKIDVTKIGKTTFYVSQINAFGCESERKSFDIMVSEIPEKPITNDLSYCRNAPSLTLVATTSPQNKVLWYASQTAKEAFAQTPKPSTKLDGEVTYFATTKNIAGCESERALLKVLVAPCIANFESNFNNCLQVSADSVKGNQWFDLYDKTGRLYASVNSNGQNLGKVSISIRHYGRGSAAIPQTQNDTKLMSRYVDFQSSLINEFDKPVSLRIYYLNDELNEYKTATNLPNLTINDFNIVHYNGISEDCGFENNDNFAAGESSVIYKNVKGNQIAKDFFYLQFDVNEFSENGVTANNFAEIILSGKETENQTVQLNWQSKYEIKAEKYIVERSSDCKDFTNISEVKANSMSSIYEYIDFQPLAGKNCYRLVYIDKDGIKKYLDTIEVNFTDKDPVCSVFTNHWAKGDEINLYLRNIKEKEIKLFDMRGQKFPFSLIKNEAQIIKIRPDIHLSKGIHFVVVIGEDGKKCVQKVVVNP